LKEAEEAVRIARFKEIAKTKVADLIKKHEDLDKHLKEQYSNLEKILSEMTVNANFDPSVQSELEWAAK
jgi:flagellar capping protein FliD